MTNPKFAQTKKVFSKFPTKKVPKGTLIFKPGDKIENVYFIRSGYVRTYIKNSSGENTLNIFKPLYIMSVMHCFVDYPNDLYFESLTPIEVSVIPKKDFLDLVAADPTSIPDFIKYFCGSLFNYVANQGTIINGSSMNKVATVLLQLSDNYGENKNNGITVDFPTTHRIIANMVGLTRETTSVQMSKLQKLGIISAKRTQFIVKDLEKLKRLSTLSQ
jgi:CRP-like cAMP-binding protein